MENAAFQALLRISLYLLAGGPGSPQDFDFDRFNRTQSGNPDGLSLDELCDKFRSVRRDTLALVEGVEDKEKDPAGV